MRTAIIALVIAGCADPDPGSTLEFPYPELPAEPQRPGDPAKGYQYLIDGGYITCGIPRAYYPFTAPASERLPGRSTDNATLPYYYSTAMSAEGVKVVSANCLLCHAGKIDGQLVIGLGAHDRDFTGDQTAGLDAVLDGMAPSPERDVLQRFRDRMRAIADYSRAITIGTNPADSLTAALMAHRDPQTLAWSDTPRLELPPAFVAPVDVPPWWRMRKKHAMFYNASGRGDHARIMMAASLLCTESVDEARAIDAAFVDVRAWITSLEPPKWPYALDATLAERGKQVFETTCARCHGTYGPNGVYPNQLVPLADVGTDPLLAGGAQAQFAQRFVDWFNGSFWGEVSRMEPGEGYVAPPLDGIWATAPYLHNGSVPTLAALLDSTQRPRYWTRTFSSTDYDRDAIGWKFTALDSGHEGLSPTAAARIYDATQLGHGNGGHLFGDDLEDAERRALLEYLKTL